MAGLQHAPPVAAYLPSEVARLILGYLRDECCTKTYQTFLDECEHLAEYAVLLKGGLSYPLLVDGKSLITILNEYRSWTMEGLHPHDNRMLTALWRRFDIVVNQLKLGHGLGAADIRPQQLALGSGQQRASAKRLISAQREALENQRQPSHHGGNPVVPMQEQPSTGAVPLGLRTGRPTAGPTGASALTPSLGRRVDYGQQGFVASASSAVMSRANAAGIAVITGTTTSPNYVTSSACSVLGSPANAVGGGAATTLVVSLPAPVVSSQAHPAAMCATNYPVLVSKETSKLVADSKDVSTASNVGRSLVSITDSAAENEVAQEVLPPGCSSNLRKLSATSAAAAAAAAPAETAFLALPSVVAATASPKRRKGSAERKKRRSTPSKNLLTPGKEDLLEHISMEEIFPMPNLVEKLLEATQWQEHLAENINRHLGRRSSGGGERLADELQVTDATAAADQAAPMEPLIRLEESETEAAIREVLAITRNDPTFGDFHALIDHVPLRWDAGSVDNGDCGNHGSVISYSDIEVIHHAFDSSIAASGSARSIIHELSSEIVQDRVGIPAAQNAVSPPHISAADKMTSNSSNVISVKGDATCGTDCAPSVTKVSSSVSNLTSSAAAASAVNNPLSAIPQHLPIIDPVASTACSSGLTIQAVLDSSVATTTLGNVAAPSNASSGMVLPLSKEPTQVEGFVNLAPHTTDNGTAMFLVISNGSNVEQCIVNRGAVQLRRPSCQPTVQRRIRPLCPAISAASSMAVADRTLNTVATDKVSNKTAADMALNRVAADKVLNTVVADRTLDKSVAGQSSRTAVSTLPISSSLSDRNHKKAQKKEKRSIHSATAFTTSDPGMDITQECRPVAPRTRKTAALHTRGRHVRALNFSPVRSASSAVTSHQVTATAGSTMFCGTHSDSVTHERALHGPRSGCLPVALGNSVSAPFSFSDAGTVSGHTVPLLTDTSDELVGQVVHIVEQHQHDGEAAVAAAGSKESLTHSYHSKVVNQGRSSCASDEELFRQFAIVDEKSTHTDNGSAASLVERVDSGAISVSEPVSIVSGTAQMTSSVPTGRKRPADSTSVDVKAVPAVPESHMKDTVRKKPRVKDMDIEKFLSQIHR